MPIIRPHGGGSLTNNFVDISKIDKDLFTLDVDIGLKNEIENICFGVFSPLKGFLNEQDFHSVINKGRLANDLPWTIPIVLDADDELAKKNQGFFPSCFTQQRSDLWGHGCRRCLRL